MNRWNEAANACLKNGELLLEDVDWLCTAQRPGSAFALAVIAQEEFAKVFLFHLISQGLLPAIPLVLRMARDHTCKQLLGLVIDHISPETDEFLRRMDGTKIIPKRWRSSMRCRQLRVKDSGERCGSGFMSLIG
jgi:AbiV family abortive infection protein